MGSSLAKPPLNIGGTVGDPCIVLYQGQTPFLVADNGQDNIGEPAATFQAVGAFALLDRSKDTVLLRELAPGAYTVQVRAKGGGGVVCSSKFTRCRDRQEGAAPSTPHPVRRNAPRAERRAPR